MLSQSYSQLGQDEAVARFFGGMRGGFFVEVGAGDGVTLSNTCALERELDWRGICVEAIPQEYERCAVARPGSSVHMAALLDVAGKEVTFRVSDQYWHENKLCTGSLLSGIEDYLAAHPEAKAGSQLRMVTETLTNILDRADAPAVIDYLSLDTEGTELLILQGVDWSRYSFKLIHVEHNFQEPQRSLIRQYLESKGYRHTRAIEWDDEYTL